MTNDALILALDEMQIYARKAEDLCKREGHDPGLSARQILVRLGYDEFQQDRVLKAVGEGGFSYCLDPVIQDTTGHYPSESACLWTVEQLRSRLDCVRIPVAV